jgi:glucosamine--fructose-6-phosphate aminotransferase (isomerizing)
MVASSGEAASHTLAEILSQPETWRSCLRELRNSSAFGDITRQPSRSMPWLFIGCGTSFYLAEAAAGAWRLLTGLEARALPASELLLFPQLANLDQQPLQAVVISRSGRTSEAVKAASLLTQKYHVATLGISCAEEPELAKWCDLTIRMTAADERSLVMTRSFSSMLLGILQIASEVGKMKSFSQAAEDIADSIASKLADWNGQISQFVSGHTFENYVYLGQGPFFSVSREASLKITEMSQSYSQAYHTLEFRHGPKAIVSPRTCLGFFLSETGMQAESEVLIEMKKLGGKILTICNRASEEVRRNSDLVFEVGASVPEVALLAPFIIPAQFLGYYTGVKKGNNPDQPKNLDRVVILDGSKY